MDRNDIKQGWDAEKAWDHLYAKLQDKGELDRLPERVQRPVLYSLSRVAAALLVLVTTGLLIRMAVLESDAPGWIEYHAGTLMENRELPDGSLVTLNAGSSIRFREGFSAFRTLELTGEAWFEVSPDPDRPFIVNCCNSRVRVLGTSFNVRSTGADRTEVWVKSGKVELAAGNEQPGIVLNPGEMGSNNRGLLSKKTEVNRNYLSWKTKEFIFADSELKEVVEVLEKAYHIEVRMDPGTVSGKRLTSTYSEMEIDDIMETIATAFNLQVRSTKKGFHLYR